MNPQLIRFVIAARKAQLQEPSRTVAAEIIERIARRDGHKVMLSAILAHVLRKEVVEALEKVQFDIAQVKEVELVLPEYLYDVIDNIVMLCVHVASAPAEVMLELSNCFSADHWAVWSLLQSFPDEVLKLLQELYSATRKGENLNWTSQKSAMAKISHE